MADRGEVEDMPDDLECRKDRHSIYKMTNEAVGLPLSIQMNLLNMRNSLLIRELKSMRNIFAFQALLIYATIH